MEVGMDLVMDRDLDEPMETDSMVEPTVGETRVEP